MTIRNQDRGNYVIKVWVCGDCNAWMNSTFENTARDLLNKLRAGHRIALNPDDPTRLAGWITKTVLMLDLWREFDRDQYLTPEDFRRFRGSGAHPAGTRTWLGSIQDADPAREAAVVHAVPAVRESAAAPRSWMSRSLAAPTSSPSTTSRSCGSGTTGRIASPAAPPTPGY